MSTSTLESTFVIDLAEIVDRFERTPEFYPLNKHLSADELVRYALTAQDTDQQELVFELASDECDIQTLSGERSFPHQQSVFEVVYDRFEALLKARVGSEMKNAGLEVKFHITDAYLTEGASLYVSY
jgi:hypothetical protein